MLFNLLDACNIYIKHEVYLYLPHVETIYTFLYTYL